MIKLKNRKYLTQYLALLNGAEAPQKLLSLKHILYTASCYLNISSADITILFPVCQAKNSTGIDANDVTHVTVGLAKKCTKKHKYIILIYLDNICITTKRCKLDFQLLKTILHELQHLSDQEHINRSPETSAFSFEKLTPIFYKLWHWHSSENLTLSGYKVLKKNDRPKTS